MQKIYFSILLFFVAFPSFGQLNCVSHKTLFGDSTICYHQNGIVSSISFPSREHYKYRLFHAFDNQGRKVMDAGQGLLHGSASLDVKYYPNGAIRSARRTFQPDGGIQHYDATSFFNEDGTFHHEEDNSWDRLVTVPMYTPLEPITQEKNTQKAINLDSLSFIIKNTSNRKVKLLVGQIGQTDRKKLVVLKKNKELEIGKYLPVKNDIDPRNYFELDLIPSDRTLQPKMVWSKEFVVAPKSYLFIVLIHEYDD